jgi:Phosphoesterase family
MEPHNPIDHVVIMDFTEVASQSELNHLMLIAAVSSIIDNANKNRTYQPQEPFNIQTLPKAPEKAKLTWAAYGDPGFSYFEKIEELKGSPNILPWTRFDTDVAAGKLPNVSWMYAPGSPVELSEQKNRVAVSRFSWQSRASKLYSNSSTTISGFDPSRSGGPHVPAPLEVKTCIFPIRLKPYTNRR